MGNEINNIKIEPRKIQLEETEESKIKIIIINYNIKYNYFFY